MLRFIFNMLKSWYVIIKKRKQITVAKTVAKGLNHINLSNWSQQTDTAQIKQTLSALLPLDVQCRSIRMTVQIGQGIIEGRANAGNVATTFNMT